MRVLCLSLLLFPALVGGISSFNIHTKHQLTRRERTSSIIRGNADLEITTAAKELQEDNATMQNLPVWDKVTMGGCPRLKTMGTCSSSGSYEKHFVRCCGDDGGRHEHNNYGGCSGRVTYDEAVTLCAGHQLHVCTAEELETNMQCGAGCMYDHKEMWTSTACTATIAQPDSTNQPIVQPVQTDPPSAVDPAMPAPRTGWLDGGCPERSIDSLEEEPLNCPCNPDACRKTWTCINAHWFSASEPAQEACNTVKNHTATRPQERCCTALLDLCKDYQTECYWNITKDKNWFPLTRSAASAAAAEADANANADAGNAQASLADSITVCEEPCGGDFDCAGRFDSVTQLSCTQNKISIISAFWGRSTCANNICYSPDFTNCSPDYRTEDGGFACGSKNNTFTAVHDHCEGKQSCTLMASTAALGDPCNGENKYLTVEYTCGAESGTTSETTANANADADADADAGTLMQQRARENVKVSGSTKIALDNSLQDKCAG